jgi:hypothetical protein
MLPLSQTCCCLWWQILSIQTILILYTLQFSCGFIFTDLKPSKSLYPWELYQGLVQWQNMTICKYKTWKSLKSKSVKIKVYMVDLFTASFHPVTSYIHSNIWDSFLCD